MFLAVVIVAAALVILVRWSGSPLRKELNVRVAEWLAAEFGEQAQIGSLHLGFRSLTMREVAIPLDHGGSSLYVESVEAGLDWLKLTADLRTPQSVIRRIHLGKSVLTLAVSQEASGSSTGSWIPQIVIPSAVFRGLESLEDLQSGEFDSCRIAVIVAGESSREICRFKGEIIPGESSGIRLIARGSYLNDSTNALTLTGTIRPEDRYAEVQLLLDVPSGTIPGLGKEFAFFTTEGGHLALRGETTDSLLTIRGSVALTGIGISIGSEIVRISDARIVLSSDSILVPTLRLEHEWFQGEVSGMAVLRERGLIELNSELHSRQLRDLPKSLIGATDVQGRISARAGVSGSWDDPRCRLSLSGEKLEIAGTAIPNAEAYLTLDRNRIVLDSATAGVGICRVEFSGEMELGEPPTIAGTGRLGFSIPPEMLGWESRLKEICFDVSGTKRDPRLHGQFVSVDDRVIGEAEVCRSDSGWQARGGVSAESSGFLYAMPTESGVDIRGENVQHWIAMLAGELQDFHAVDALDFQFRGNERSGDLSLHAAMKPIPVESWIYLPRDVQFRGTFAQSEREQTNFSGQWTVVTGDGFPYEGRGRVTLKNKRIEVNQFVVDHLGDVRGWIDLETRVLDVDVSISELSLETFLSEHEWSRRMALQGDVTGYLQVSGSLQQPNWMANVAMTYGSVLGIGGYWINLESDGIGRRINLRNFELGRDIRRITSATGVADFDEDSLAIRAVIESADANDVFLALTGRRNVFTGNLSAWAAISGRFSQPDIEAEVSIDRGELFDELYADECRATLQTSSTPDGRRVYRIPECIFRKEGVYRFVASGEIETPIGRISGVVEGNGDFLDLVDQVDRTFQTLGSSCSLRTEFGGTLKDPELLGAALTIRDGRFSYIDASPSVLETEAALCLSAGGFVEPGYLRFRVGERQLEIATVPADQSARSGLESLVIPTPHIQLGVIEISTGAAGMPLRLPGLMRPDWSGVFSFGSSDGIPVTISSAGEGRLSIEGQAGVRSARLTFPFVGGSGNPRPVAKWLMDRLKEAQWDLSVAVESGNHYRVEITGLKDSEMFAPLRSEPIFNTLAEYIDHLSIDAMINPTDHPIRLSGRIDEETFRLSGRLTSARGTADYLDQTFRVDRVTADFDETDVMPILEGRGITQGMDSLGRPVQVYLTMYQVDRETDTRQTRGRLDHVTFVLESDVTETPEQTLALLGYDQTGLGGKAEQVVTSAVARVLGRRWLDPLERRLERWTLLDEIALNPVGGRGTPLARQQREKAISDTLQQSSVVRFFSGSQVTVGKYVTPDLFLTYTGELAEGQVDVGTRIGFVHLWNVEYRMNPLSRDLVLDFAIEYDEIERQRDESISLKYSFALEP